MEVAVAKRVGVFMVTEEIRAFPSYHLEVNQTSEDTYILKFGNKTSEGLV